MKNSYRIFFVFFIVSCSSDLIPEPDRDQRIVSEIIALMDQQEVCWNSGDLECFMQPYWHDDSLMFVGKSGVTYGWQKTLENYKKSYPDKNAMGELQFTNINISVLSSSSCYVIGKWELKRPIGDLSGHYTLLWINKNNSWKIISDHSS